MSDDDLIRRGDALNAVFTSDFRHDAHAAIAALPAQGVRVRALEWADYEEIVRDAQSGMHYASRALNGFNAYFVMQDGEQFRWWTSGHQTDHSVAHPTFDAAKAAAQADYERRILAALAPASGGVDALVKAAEEAAEVVHKAYVSATMEAVNAGPSHPLKDNFDKWRVRCLRAEEALRAALAAYRGEKP